MYFSLPEVQFGSLFFFLICVIVKLNLTSGEGSKIILNAFWY